MIPNMYDAIDKARIAIVFLSSAYCSKVAVCDSSYSTDHVQLEYNYIVKKKKPSNIIFAIMEEQLLPRDSRFLPPLIRNALGASRSVNMTSDSTLEGRTDELYGFIAEVLAVREARPAGSTMQVIRNSSNPFPQTQQLLPTLIEPPPGVDVSSGEAQELVRQMRQFAIPRSREEVQLYQWLERSTNITESRRVVYMAAFLRAGLTSVKQLATHMMSRAECLVVTLGLNDFDADEINLAVRDLGMGSVSETDFGVVSSLESAQYAMHKSSQETTNHKMAVNALACVTRIAGSSHDMPAVMGQTRFCESVLKLLCTHLDDAATVEQGCRSFEKLARNCPANIAQLGVLGVADLLPRLAVRHINNSAVLESIFNVVGIVSENAELRQKFGINGVCEVVTKGLALTLTSEACAERACFAFSRMTTDCYDNVWKLGANGACVQLVECLRLHPHNSKLVQFGFLAYSNMTTFEENRARFAVPGAASVLVAAARHHLNNPDVALLACVVMYCNVYGVAYNCKLMGEGGACELVRESLVRYAGLPTTAGEQPTQQPHPGILREACTAIGILAAGNPPNQSKFDGLRPLVQSITQQQHFGDDVRKAAGVALSRLR